MIAAYQSAKLDVAGALLGARTRLAEIISSIALDRDDASKIHSILSQLDELFAHQIPNAHESS